MGTVSSGKTEHSPSGRLVILLDHGVPFSQLLGDAKLLRKETMGVWAACSEEARWGSALGACLCNSSLSLRPHSSQPGRRSNVAGTHHEFTSTIISEDLIGPWSVLGTVGDKRFQVLEESEG